ncbi:histone acetyltransferase, putative [Plasmodium malariae]|uniref:RNA cytidine acetyltransferase n=1 Tax=Plasmodium malariae TaxID=5858 RepID=A0A1D3JJD2_PLAMA|nr:histone acetyltransferase, putative [Plasmodium malariae]SBT86636.1 histone acetyltransferase, putative [Plasmodium malariae]
MKKKVDSRIKTLVENNLTLGQRSMFLVVGDQGKNVVVNFHFLLNRLVRKTHNILWCYKKKLDFSTSKKKRFREMKKKIKKGIFDSTVDNNFDAFINNANINYCFYKDTQKVLGKTFSLCVLQDFSYITPNILCRCIETVIGGGIIIFLINKLDELRDIYNLTLNYHKKYMMNGVCNVYNNYIHRFFLSLNKCKNAMFIDDEMNILPLNDNHLHVKKLSTDLSSGSKCAGEGAASGIDSDVENNGCHKHSTTKGKRRNERESSNVGSATLGGFLCPDKKELQEKILMLQSICEENERKKEERQIFLYSSKFYNTEKGTSGWVDRQHVQTASDEEDSTAATTAANNTINAASTDANRADARNVYGFLDRNVMNVLRLSLSIDQLDVLLSMCKILRNDEEKKKKIKEILFSLLANRGRGKSATLGLLLSLSIYFNYSNIIICSGNNDGVHTIYEFLDKGLNILGFKEFKDYEKVYVCGKIKEIIIFKNIKYIKQRIHYCDIIEEDILNCELMIIDEAACIPIDVLRNKIKGEITILSTTLNGYEGTGKTFTFKLLKQLKKKYITQLTYEEFKEMSYIYFDKAFIEISLNNPIRYSYNDEVEIWLNNFLCLNCNETDNLKDNLCSPSNCQLYYVNKNIFKNYNKSSEILLKKIMTLFVTSHYKNTPNDLIMLLDSKQHHLFILINNKNVDMLVDNVDEIDIYAALHCAIDGIIDPTNMNKVVRLEDIYHLVKQNKEASNGSLTQNDTTRGRGARPSEILSNELELELERAQVRTDYKKNVLLSRSVDERKKENAVQCDNSNGSHINSNNSNGNSNCNRNNPVRELNTEFEGNLIPYIISDYFNYYFYNYIGIRIVRISVHPSVQNLNYGSEFLKRISEYYSLYNSKERTKSRMYKDNIILYNCKGDNIFFDEKLKKIDYIGTCFGLTKGLLMFWQKNKFIPIFLKQQKNEITGEYSILMVKHINKQLENVFINFYLDFVRSLRNLLSFAFRKLEVFIVFNLLHYNSSLLSNHHECHQHTLLKNEYNNALDPNDNNDHCSFYDDTNCLNEENIFYFFHQNDICRLRRYVNEGRNFYEILYLMTTIATLILFKKVHIDLSFLEYTVLYAVSFQHKTCKEIADEISVNVNQVNAIFRKIVHRFYSFVKDIMEKQIEKEVNEQLNEQLKKKKKKRSLNGHLSSDAYVDELKKESITFKKKHKKEKQALMKELNLSGYIKRKQINVKTNDHANVNKHKLHS